MSTDRNIAKVKKYLLFLSAVPAMFIVSPTWATDSDTAVPEKGRYQQMLEKYDVDKDGQLSAEEKEVARESMQGQGGGPGKGGPGKGGPGGPNHKQFRQQMIERFDADGDGQLSPEERDAARAAMQDHAGPGGKGGFNRHAMLERFDTDGDGQLSPEERDAARAAMKDAGGKGGMHRQAMMERFDTDGDGVLSPEERDVARATIHAEGGRGGKGGQGAQQKGPPPPEE
jgi:Ca2+-binding EF-hand superfamily protein